MRKAHKVGVSRFQPGDTMFTVALDAVTTAALLFIISSGLLIVFGVMKIINFAHAAFVTVGGYAALVGAWLGLPWALVLPLAFAAGAVCGALTEAIIVRRLYQRPLDAILATWGLGIVIGQLITLLFGREVQFVQAPITGTVDVVGVDYSAYRIVMIAAAVIVAVVFTSLLGGTRLGLSTRAVIMNETLAQGLGINSARVRLVTFAIGSGLAALSGALITPLSSVDPNMGLPWLISAFMLVMVSGGSLLALAVSCLVLGGCQVIVSTFVNPILGGLTIAILAAIVLRIRPEGFARA
jgi:branched-chain amino acid transport system permease protein